MTEVIMMIAPSGCGKSTFCNLLEDEGYTVVSSDAIRKELFGDESIQKDHQKVFYTAFNRIFNCIKNGEDVVFDATNLKMKDRKNFFDYMKKAPAHKTIGYVVACSFETAVAHNAMRERHVPIEVIHRQFSQFEMPQYYEGFDEIMVDRNDYIDESIICDFARRMKAMKHDNCHHNLDVGAHCYAVAKGMGEPNSFEYKIGLWHDIGKLYTKSFTNKKGEISTNAHFFDHEKWSTMYYLLIEDCENCVIGAQTIALHMDRYRKKDYSKWLEGLATSEDARVRYMAILLEKLNANDVRFA